MAGVKVVVPTAHEVITEGIQLLATLWETGLSIQIRDQRKTKPPP